MRYENLSGIILICIGILLIVFARPRAVAGYSNASPGYIPIGSSSINNSSLAWFIDPNKNEIVVCQAIAATPTLGSRPTITGCGTTLYAGPDTQPTPVPAR
jgi:hypothetical protein